MKKITKFFYKMSLTYNISNPYSFKVTIEINVPGNPFKTMDVCRQLHELSNNEKRPRVDEFIRNKTLILKYFDDIEEISKNTYRSFNQINNQILNVWKLTLKILYPELEDEIDKIDNPWVDDSTYNESDFPQILINNSELQVNIYKIKNYTLYDIYYYPSNNQFGVIFLKYNSKFYPIFENGDMNLRCLNIKVNNAEVSSLISMIENYILSLEEKRINKVPSVCSMIDTKFFSYKYNCEMTTLMESAAEGIYDSVKFLIENCASLNIKNSLGMSAADYALQKNHMEIFYYLMHNGAIIY